MTTVQSTLLDSSGSPVANSPVSVQLGGVSNGRFFSVSGWGPGGEVVAAMTITTNSAGVWTTVLVPNSSITPGNTVYQVSQQVNGEHLWIIVPDSTQTLQAQSLLVSQPQSLDVTAAQLAVNAAASVKPGVAGGIATLDGNAHVPVAQLDVGTAAGTVAAGDDPRIVGAAQTANNLSDLASPSVARGNLGLGSAATASTTAFDASGAASAAQAASLAKSNNLSDLPDASAARSNLGLAAVAASGSASDIKTGTLPAAQVPDLSASYLPQGRVVYDAKEGPNAVVWDGVTDDTAHLTSLLSAANTAGLPLQLPPGTGIVTTLTVPTGSRIVGAGSGATMIKQSATATGVDAVALDVSGTTGVRISGITVDGNLSAFGSIATQQKHALLADAVTDLSLTDVVLQNAKGDGLYVGSADGVTHSANVRAYGVTCTGNYRNGMSIIDLDGGVFTACRFVNTAGTAPQAGVDVEPNGATYLIRNVKFVACDVSGNTGPGVSIVLQAAPTAVQAGIDLVGCDIMSNTADGLLLVNASAVRVSGGSSASNGGSGVNIDSSTGPSNDVTLQSVALSNNGGAGIIAQTVFNRLTVVGCTVMNNSQTVSGSNAGIDLLPNGASSGLSIVGCVSGGATQKYGARDNSNVSSVYLIGNSYPGNGTAATSLADNASLRVQIDETAAYVPASSVFYAKSTWVAAVGTTIIGLSVPGDTANRVALRTDGAVTWSSGAAAQDTQLSRVATGVLGVGAAQCLRTGVAATASRPSASAVGAGSQFFDSTLNRPIWSTGTGWVDAAGAAV